MALITLGSTVSNISGSIGGTTYARNRGGAYARNRTVGLNPKTPAQFGVRLAFGGLAQAWSDELTPANRSAWDSYAEATPIVNRLGQERTLSGINMFVRGNSLNAAVGVARVDQGPSDPGVGSAFGLGVSIDVAEQTLDVTSIGGIVNYPAHGRGLYIQMSRPQRAGVNFFAGPFLAIYGELQTDPMVLPTDIPLPFEVQEGQTVFIRHTWVDVLGRGGLASVQRIFLAS